MVRAVTLGVTRSRLKDCHEADVLQVMRKLSSSTDRASWRKPLLPASRRWLRRRVALLFEDLLTPILGASHCAEVT
jgi:hypothetical protein